jgi:hypothetical protein
MKKMSGTTFRRSTKTIIIKRALIASYMFRQILALLTRLPKYPTDLFLKPMMKLHSSTS